VRATFFVTGSHLAAHRDVGERILRAGHALGNHSWDDEVLAFTAPVDIRKGLDRTDALIQALGYRGPIDFRSPHGMPGPVTLGVLLLSGRRHVLGTSVGDRLHPGERDGECAERLVALCPTQDPGALLERVLAAASPGAILVLHDGDDRGPGADRSGTVEAVRRAIPALREAGYRFATVPELLDGTK
jgi:peptidoglycan/xylan/chitin deacetylase (PgdA/CDA1 family)